MIPNKLREILYKKYQISFSKAGDDIQLMKLIQNSSPGTYVDVGCWHPFKASNTYYFYLRGWKGICIDPNPELETKYKKYRPNDAFVNCAIGTSDTPLQYFMLNDPHSSMNSLDSEFIENHQLKPYVKEVRTIPVFSLASVLEKHVKRSDRLDFFDIDVEGHDLEVLKTNDWSKFRPKIVVVESDTPLEQDLNTSISTYLKEVDYRLIGKSIINNNLGNLFYLDTTL
jgi:FkbM family methyltransferase